MTDLRKIFLLTIVPIFVLGLLAFLTFVKINSTEEEIVEYILPLTLNGRVVDKQIDLNNHATKYVVIKDKNENSTVLYDSFWFPIFDKSAIGDSIYKNDGSARLFIVDKNQNQTEIRYQPSSLYFHKRDWLKKMNKN